MSGVLRKSWATTLHNCSLNPAYRTDLLRPAKRFASSYNKTQLPRSLLVASEEIQDALVTGKPIVALETALVTHGMPYPENLRTALSIERCVRESGAIPATIGVLKGRIHVGLSQMQLEQLADIRNTPSSKVSRRDISAVCATKGNGGTTIAGTMVIAHMTGIKVFSTGGLGGVHRGGENSLDISADLTELGRTPVAVLAGGIKSILDIGRTLEYLETQGVPVITYGRSKEFPAFFSPRSGFQSAYNAPTPLEAAKIIYYGDLLGMENGYVFGCPIPEEYAEAGERIQMAVDLAVEESRLNGLDKRGKEVTPWLLNRVYELTGGLSLENNVALIENSARIGGKVAVEYARLRTEKLDVTQNSSPFPGPRPVFSEKDSNINLKAYIAGHATSAQKQASKVPKQAKVAIVGGAAVDIISKAGLNSPVLRSTAPGTVRNYLGGVARNVAEATHRIRVSLSEASSDDVLLVAPIGDDSFGTIVQNGLTSLGMRTDGLIHVSNPSSSGTAVCNMVLDGSGDLVGGVADMDIINELKSENILPILNEANPSLLAFDSNISVRTMTDLCVWAKKQNITTFVEPTSVIKSTRIVDVLEEICKTGQTDLPGTMLPSALTYISPNILELQQIYESLEAKLAQRPFLRDWWWSVIDDLGLDQDYLSQLAILSKQRISEVATSDNETLDFLTEKGVARMAVQLLPFFQYIFIKCGKAGVLLAMRTPNTPAQQWNSEKSDPRRAKQVIFSGRSSIFTLKHYPAISLEASSVVNVTGAGDSLVGSLLASISSNPDIMQSPELVDKMIHRAQQAAVLTLGSNLAVSPELGSVAHF
ncbi:hypothetical protein FRC17_003368 [Serendipita sp. 399]|nr:hypothetical protein FRC17_003368 [Serendipita sp. 399]